MSVTHLQRAWCPGAPSACPRCMWPTLHLECARGWSIWTQTDAHVFCSVREKSVFSTGWPRAAPGNAHDPALSPLGSTRLRAMKVAASPWCRRAAAWRTSVPRLSLSATGAAGPATTTPTSTASGSPPSQSRASRAHPPPTPSRPGSSGHTSAVARCA